MELSAYFKSVIDSDTSAVVICDTSHTIIYMNPSACQRYHKRGGEKLVGKSLLDCHNETSRQKIKEVVCAFENNSDKTIVHTYFNSKENKDVYMVALRDDEGRLIGYYEKHEYRTPDSTELYNI